MAAMKVYVVGGLLLVLGSPFWILGVRWAREQNESVWVYMVRMQADDWARWLGVLALVLGLLQGYVALSKGLKIAAAVLFLVGSVLMPYGTVCVLGEFRDVDVVYFLGVGLVGLTLLANLWGVLRFSVGFVEPKKL